MQKGWAGSAAVILPLMDWYEPEVQALEAARRLRGPSAPPVIFYGSSTIRLWTDLAADLEAPGTLNLGFGGSTLEACVYFFERLIVPEKPRSLVLYAGDNDLGDGRSAQQVFRYFRDFAAKMKNYREGTNFGFISVKPSPVRFPILGQIRDANRLIKEHISTLTNAYFIDIFDAMLNTSGTPRTELFDSEGLHMNRDGYRLWSELLKPYRNQMFMLPSSAVQTTSVSFREE